MNGAGLPLNWTRRRLRFSAQLNPVKSELDLADEAEVSFVPMDAVGELGGLRLDEQRAVDEVYSGYTYFRDGDVVIAKITPCFENCKGALAVGLANGVGFGTTELHVVRPGDKLDARFLFYITISHDLRCYGASEMLGAGGQKRVPERFLKDWRAALPSLETQERITRFLDEKTAQIDALLAKKQTLLKRLTEKRQATITHAVTKGLNSAAPMKDSGIEWLGQIPAHWGIIPLKWQCSIQSGQVDPTEPPYDEMTLIAPDHIESGTGRLLAKQTATDQAAISGKYLCQPHDVLYSKIRPALRKVTLTDETCLCSADMYAITPGTNFCRDYLFYFFLTDAFTAYAELASMRVAMPKVNREALGSFPLPKPPGAEQQVIISFLKSCLSEIDGVVGSVKISVARLIEYRSALVAAAVTGQIKGMR